MWSPLADRPPRSVAPAATSCGHQSARFGGTWIPTPGSSSRVAATSSRHVVDRHLARPLGQRQLGLVADPGLPVAARGVVGDLRRLLRRSSAGAGRSSGGSPPAGARARRAPRRAPPATRSARRGVSPMPTRMPLVNGILSSPAARIVSSRRAGCFVGEPAWTVSISRSLIDSSISPCEAVTSRSRARSARSSTPRFVCGSSPRSSARSQTQATYDVKSVVPVLLQARRDARVDLRLLARQDEQLLGARRRSAGRAAARPRRARRGASGASRTRSTCSSSDTCATATACSCART